MTSGDTARPSPGLRDRIVRILHWELNVRDLERSIAFYEALTSFRAAAPVESTTPDGRTRSCLLTNAVDEAPTPGLRLVQWLDPEPFGQPHRDEASVGFFRIVFHSPDIAQTRSVAESVGVRVFAPTTGDDFRFEIGSRGSVPFTVWACHDPDGVVVEFVERAVPKLSTVAQGTTDLDGQVSFITGVLGLDFTDRVATPGPVPNVYVPDGVPVEFTGAFFHVRGEELGYLDVLRHRRTPPGSEPYRRPQHVGVMRCAFEVDDVDAADRALAEHGVHIDEAPTTIDFGGALGPRRALAFRDPEGVGYRLVGASITGTRPRQRR